MAWKINRLYIGHTTIVNIDDVSNEFYNEHRCFIRRSEFNLWQNSYYTDKPFLIKVQTRFIDNASFDKTQLNSNRFIA